MKTYRRIGALILALAMVLAMSTTAFAADMDGEEGVIGEFTTPDTEINPLPGDTVTIYKEITALNPEDSTVNAPTITYTYGIAAGSAGKTITDASSHHAQISDADVNVSVTTKAGVGSPVITGTTSSNSTTGNGALYITPADQLEASEFGTANRFAIAIDFSAIDYTTTGSGAGVYRYVITETCAEVTKNAAGIAEGTVANTLYMDVYVNGNGDIYGYTLFTTNGDIDASPDDDAGAATAVGKTEGFVGSKPDGDPYTADDSAADKYYTFNLTLTKDVVNDAFAESTHHEFPFTVTLTNTTVTANVLPIMTVSTNATQTALSAGPIAATWNPTIADGATIEYVGIPCGTTVTIYETNDVTGVVYKASIENADTNGDAKEIATNEDSNNAVISCGATALTAATENHTASANKVVTFTNTLLLISPTGLALRIAPYVLMLVGGALLLILGRKKTSGEKA